MNPICPFCRAPIEGDEVPECPDCGIPHHLECWIENNGCSIPGCSQAPDDEPKMSVNSPGTGSQGEARRVPMAAFPAGQGLPVTSIDRCAAKSRSVFMVLGLILGPFGIHNFYAGYTLRGTFQLALTCATLFYGAAVTWCWAVIEILMVSHDAVKRPME